MTELYRQYKSLEAMLRGKAGEFAECRAVWFRGESVTYGALEVLSNQIANALEKDGISRGDHVALYCINSPYFVAAYFGILKAGGRVVPINLLLNTREVSFILNDSDAKGLIFFDGLEEVVAGLDLERISARMVIGESKRVEARALSEVMQKETGERELPQIDARKETAVIIYTSGTTGRPKGAMLTHHNLLHNVNSVSQALPVGPEDRFLTVLPMFHSFGATACMLTPISLGATIVAVPKFSPEEVTQAVEQTRATVFMGVPSMYTVFANIRDDREPDFSSLRVCISGGAALPVEVMKRFEERYDVPILEGDGPTECSPVTSVNPFHRERKPGSIGLPIPEVSMKIVDEEGRERPVGEVGEIVVSGENVMKGYLNLPEETEASFFGEWYRTGDMGYEDEDGYFYIVDRKKDLIIVNGMNVYPRMVEEVLYEHPGVAEAAVVPEPHRLHGEVPRAVIVRRPDAQVDRDEILSLCRERLGRHQVPRIVEFVDELPKTPTGKILKRALLRNGEVERGIDIDPRS